MSESHRPQRADTSDFSSPQITIEHAHAQADIRVLETRVRGIEDRLQANTNSTSQMGRDVVALTSEVESAHKDIDEIKTSIIGSRKEMRADLNAFKATLKWVAGIIITVGLGLGISTITQCSQSREQAAEMRTQMKHLDGDVKEIKDEIQPIRTHLLSTPPPRSTP